MTVVYKQLGDINLEENVVVSADPIPDTLTVNNLVVGSGEAFGNGCAAVGYGTAAYTANSLAVGTDSQAGSRSFKILSGDASLSTLTLDSVQGIRPGMKVAYRLLNNYNVFGLISDVDAESNTLTLSGMVKPGRYDERLDDPYLQETGNPMYDPSGNSISVHYGYWQVSPVKKFTPEVLDYDLVSQLWVIGRPDLGTQFQMMEDAFAHGWGCIAQGSQSHAEGIGSVAYGRYSHAEGQYTFAGYDAHAEGNYTWAGSHWSHSNGVNAIAKDSRSYVWNGATNANPSEFPNEETYYSNGAGTFNINPVGGAKGFFIGLSSLEELLVSVPKDPRVEELADGLKDVQDAFGDYQYTALPDKWQPLSGSFAIYKTGNIQSPFSSTQCTEPIPCRPGDKFMINYKIDNNIAAYCFYDAVGRFVRSANADSNEKPGGGYVWEDYLDVSDHLEQYMKQDFEVEIPEGCAYVRFSSRLSGVPGGGMNIRKRKASYAAFLARIDAIERQLAGLGGRLDEIMA